MFSKALASFTSNISSNYTISPHPSSTAGPWNIFDAKRKQAGRPASVFVFDPKSLLASGTALGGRGSASGLKRAHEEVLERLRREAGNLARLRHPSILELQEPVEETRNGGLMFATEPVTASLAALLAEKDEQERSRGVGGRGSRYVVEEQDGTRRRRELEIDELEIQKGLLQLGKGLEFLHESAGLVHANLTPDAVLVNAKGDWKLAGLGFAGPHESSTAATSLVPISLGESLNHDPRLPRSVQLSIDYTSPDFVLDNTLTSSADMFSLGLLIVALYNSPHTSPISTSDSPNTYKRIFSSSTSVPTQSNNFLLPKFHPLPHRLASELLPRLITRRPAQRMTAREFQEASYFDNILVSTIRFLDALPAKTPNEKAAFMRGLPKIIPLFPKSVLEKKVLPALLEEMKDRELLAPILQNVFAMVQAMPTGKRAFTEKVVPRLREIFLTKPAKGGADGSEKETGKEAGLMVLLENMQTAAENCPGKVFSEDILPIVLLALESNTHALVDAALGTLPHVLPVLDFSTIKNELFPVIANGFAKTSSLAIKIKGLEAFHVLCGGTPTHNDDGSAGDDGLNGFNLQDKKASSASNSSAILDKFTVQEKVVPLLKGIKTKEPGVMMAALKVFRQVGEVADGDFLAMEVLPVLWSFSLGPLLNLQQFEAFMGLIKKLGSRIEREQSKKLQEMAGANGGVGVGIKPGGRQASGVTASGNGLTNGEETEFEALVSGHKPVINGNEDLMNDWVGPSAIWPTQPRNVNQQQANPAPTFSWQTPTSSSQTPQSSMSSALRPQAQIGRTVTPDQTLSSFASLTPASQFAQPLQPSRPPTGSSTATTTTATTTSSLPVRTAHLQANSTTSGTGIDWSSTTRQQQQPFTNGFGATAARSAGSGGFSLPPPPTSPQALGQNGNSGGFPGLKPPIAGAGGTSGQQKGGLDRYQSLI